MPIGTVRKTLPLEFGQLQRALTITSAGYAEPAAAPGQLQHSLTITSAGYAVPASMGSAANAADSASKVGVVIESHPEIMIQPIAPPGQTAATAVFQMPVPENAAAPQSEQVLSAVNFGQIYEA